MPSEDNKLLQFNQCQNSDQALFIIYADLECIIEKIDCRKNNPENSSATKVSEHIPSGFACVQYYHLQAQKISMVYTEAKLV